MSIVPMSPMGGKPSIRGITTPATLGELVTESATGALSSVSLLFVPKAGTYVVGGYVVVRTAGAAGTVTATLAWNDGSGRTSALINLLTLAALGPTSFVTTIRCAANTFIALSTTVAGIIGSPVYDLYAFAERKSA